MAGLSKAIAKLSSQAALAKALGVSPMTITNWKVRGVPPMRCQAIEDLTGVPCHELRPDVFRPPRRRGVAA